MMSVFNIFERLVVSYWYWLLAFSFWLLAAENRGRFIVDIKIETQSLRLY